MDATLALAGLGVGAVIGLTGMGGGALMTPILVLLFGVPPLAAVSSDLLASAVMKPFGGLVHARRRTVHWRMVGWLCVGSVPSAFSGVLVMRALGDGAAVQHVVQLGLGVALLLAAFGMVAKGYVAARQERRAAARDGSPLRDDSPLRDGSPAGRVRVRPLPTVLLGAVGGLVVGMTSVGSGSLIIVALLLLYPALRANDLVGTDLVQAIPLVAAAATSHAFFGDLHLDLTGSLLLGAIPGVLLGAALSSRAPGGVVRTALVVVLLASALKLLGTPNPVLAVVVLAATGVAVGIGVRWLGARGGRGPGAGSTASRPAEPRRPYAVAEAGATR